MSLSPAWAVQLEPFDPVHWSTVGSPSAPDEEIFEYAVQHDLVIFTHDLDFGTLLAARRTGKPSVIQLRQLDVLPSAAGELVLASIKQTLRFLESGALVTIEPARNRLRILPL